MSDTYRCTIPYESLDPMTIAAGDDPLAVQHERLELEIPAANLLADIRPPEPTPIADLAAAARVALETPLAGPPFSQLLGPEASVCILLDNQFRPTPVSRILPAVLDAIDLHGARDVRVVCAGGKDLPMSDADAERKIGRANLERMHRMGIAFHQNDPRNPAEYSFVGISSRGTPIWLLREVACCDVKLAIAQVQADPWGYGGGGQLILPGVVSDETIESNHAAFAMSPRTHYGALSGPMRGDIDEVATLCGLTCTLDLVLDTRGSAFHLSFGSHPAAHREAVRQFNRVYAFDRPAGGPADIAVCGVFASADHLFFNTCWGCMSSDLVVRDGGTLIYCSPSPGVRTSLGELPGLALMEPMRPYLPESQKNLERIYRDIHRRRIEMWGGAVWVPIYEIMTRKHLTLVTRPENLALAAEIGFDATSSLEEALGAAFNRHGRTARVVILPYARYQLPRDAVRLPSG